MKRHTNRTQRVLAGLVLAVAALGGAAAAHAEQVAVNPAMSHPFLLAGQKHTAYLKVGMTAFEMEDTERPAVNVAIVIDRSGSMSGAKLQRAKEAAIMAVQRLHPDDIVSVVAYDHNVTVLVPATKARDRRTIVDGIRRLYPGGNTALFAGVCKGAEEVRKFFDRKRVNRIVLLSDGLANVGPSAPSELGALGASLGREGIGVTTIGLGLDFNEDLMTQLAGRSEGNHFFAATADDLRQGFELEFGIGLAVAAKEVAVRIRCAEGVRPVRVLNTEADILGQEVIAQLSQLYSKREAYVLVEVEVPAGPATGMMQVAEVDVSYADMRSHATDRVIRKAAVHFTDSPGAVKSGINKAVMATVAMHLGNERYKMALEYRDQGRVQEAQQLLEDNYRILQKQSEQYKSPMLYDFSQSNIRSSQNLNKNKWKKERKRMRDEQLELDEPAAAY